MQIQSSRSTTAFGELKSSAPQLDKDAQAVRRAIMANLDTGHDVVAVAHSFGGVAMSEAVKGLGKEARNKQGLPGGVLRLVYMCAMALPEGQTHLGQLQPRTPEEEELERKRQEYGEKHGGMKFTEVCTYSVYFSCLWSLMRIGWGHIAAQGRYP